MNPLLHIQQEKAFPEVGHPDARWTGALLSFPPGQVASGEAGRSQRQGVPAAATRASRDMILGTDTLRRLWSWGAAAVCLQRPPSRCLRPFT